MTDFAFVNLADGTISSQYPVGPLPYQIEAWANDFQLLEDLDKTNSDLGYTGLGAYPVIYLTPSFDPQKQKLTGVYQYVVNPNKTVSATQDPVDLTDAELATVLTNAKTTKSQVINDTRDLIMGSGWVHDFGDPLGVHVLQTRTNEDRTNWLTSQATYSALVAAGHGATVDANFRDQNNQTFVLSYSDGLNTLLLMAAWGASVMKMSWDLKDTVAAATTLDALNAIDITTGWPQNNAGI